MVADISKTLILGFPRTGSTAFYDLYRKYVEKEYPDYIRTPSEVACSPNWSYGTDYDLIEDPFGSFFEKHPDLEGPRLKYDWYFENDQGHLGKQHNYYKFPQSLFKRILQEPHYILKIFPLQIKYHDVGKMITTLKQLHEDQNANIVCFYRRNIMDVITSYIRSTESLTWSVHELEVFKRELPVNKIRYEYIEEMTTGVQFLLNSIKYWYDLYIGLVNQGVEIPRIAYEDVDEFNSDLLCRIHNIKITEKFSCGLVKQHPSDEKEKIKEKYSDVIENALSGIDFNLLPFGEDLILDLDN